MSHSNVFVVALFCAIPVALWFVLAVTRPRKRPRRMVIVCHRCGETEEIHEITDETVGTWDEPMTCSRCKTGNELAPDRIVQEAALRRGQPPVYSWDAACEQGCSYQGYGLDELLLRLLQREARKTCAQCGVGDCTHEAARLVLEEVKAAWNGG